MKHFLICTLFLVFFAAHVTLAAEDNSAPREFIHPESIHPVPAPPIVVRPDFPTLVEAIRFSGDIRLCGEQIPYTDPEVRERFEKEMLLAVWNQPQVILWLKRAQRWFPLIEKVLQQENLPLDLKYLPIVESALLSHGESYQGAVGYWQFIKSTGQRYGLRIDSNVDERRNMFCATRAACRYLKDLHSQFGSYLLVMSAYNMGETGLSKAISLQETRDFFSLYLPLETQRYILKMAAVKLIMSDPKKYGYYLEPQDLYPAFTFSEIRLYPEINVPLSMVARACGVSFKTIKDYNPQMLGYYLQKGPATLLVPEGKNKDFQARFDLLYKPLAQTQTVAQIPSKFHMVRAGEGLSVIAKKYNISVSALLALNKMSTKDVIHPGDKLRVP